MTSNMAPLQLPQGVKLQVYLAARRPPVSRVAAPLGDPVSAILDVAQPMINKYLHINRRCRLQDMRCKTYFGEIGQSWVKIQQGPS